MTFYSNFEFLTGVDKKSEIFESDYSNFEFLTGVDKKSEIFESDSISSKCTSIRMKIRIKGTISI